MELSVVVITKDEAPRLDLVLMSLSPALHDGVTYEVVVVDDGSSDETAEVIAEHTARLPLVSLRHERPQGRSAARNAGAGAASGNVLLFLDGDCVAAPGAIAAHAHAHRRGASMHAGALIGRGETYHLRCTRFFHDPQRGIAFPDHVDRVARTSPTELERSLVTKAQVLERFDEITSRAEAGIYPGAAPRRLYELEMRALRDDPGSSVLWMAVAAQNLSVTRAAFVETGGFDVRITINEHRELALRLCEGGARVMVVEGARTYHLTHRVGWRDPLTADPDWERIFYERHSQLSVRLMQIFWQSLAGDAHIPPEARIHSLEQMDQIVRQGTSVNYDAIRRAHPSLRPLGDE